MSRNPNRREGHNARREKINTYEDNQPDQPYPPEEPPNPRWNLPSTSGGQSVGLSSYGPVHVATYGQNPTVISGNSFHLGASVPSYPSGYSPTPAAAQYYYPTTYDVDDSAALRDPVQQRMLDDMDNSRETVFVGESDGDNEEPSRCLPSATTAEEPSFYSTDIDDSAALSDSVAQRMIDDMDNSRETVFTGDGDDEDYTNSYLPGQFGLKNWHRISRQTLRAIGHGTRYFTK